MDKNFNKTMHETYGEPNDEWGKHICCSKCGFCKTCGSCSCKTSNKNQQCLNGEKPIEGRDESQLYPTRTIETPDKGLVDNTRTTPADKDALTNPSLDEVSRNDGRRLKSKSDVLDSKSVA